ncbi:MAG TPA: TonB family protein [Longimicrobiales bacterium]|nr:TonB family protein [Longimicrobiales bacterium]
MATGIHSTYAIAKAQSLVFAISLTVSVGAHFALFSWNPAFRTGDVAIHTTELTALEIPPEVEIPPAPQTIARPATPVISSLEVDDNITIAPTTFEANPISSIPPPAIAVREEEDLRAAPRFTPYTVKPELRNPDEVRAALTRNYPSLLRDAGIGGTVLLWVFIDESGVVQSSVVHTSSGHAGLDEAALVVAPQMKFTPAINRDRRVPVWIELPLLFTVR